MNDRFVKSQKLTAKYAKIAKDYNLNHLIFSKLIIAFFAVKKLYKSLSNE